MNGFDRLPRYRQLLLWPDLFDRWAALEMVEALLARGVTLHLAAAIVGKSKSTVHRWAIKYGFTRRHWTTEHQHAEILRLLREAVPRAEVARRIGVPVDRVGRVERQLAHVRGDGEELYTRECKPRRCPTCRQIVTVWPCVRCAGQSKGS